MVLRPVGEEPIRIEGLHSYFGEIELRPAADGLVVVDRLPLEKYLLGLDEVPADWPEEALRAQAIAARTYALWTLAQPPAGAAATYGFDICASVQCQVFSGADVVLEGGERWAEAVLRTRDLAVLYDGEPILARYHSTSGGMTLDNEQVFESEGPYPYLESVSSTTEEASPLYRWRTRFPLSRLSRMLSDAGLWRGRLASARTVPSSAGLHYPDVELVARDGARVFISAEQLRVVVREAAPALWPDSYPGLRPDGLRLPETFPSNRYEMTTSRGIARIVGRGWGHGVGMSQWGAHGMALDGADHEQILEHYYTGASVGLVETGPPIDVGVAWGAQQLSVSGHFSIISGEESLVDDALGTWGFSPEGGATRIDPPAGFGLPLHIGILGPQQTLAPGESVRIRFALSKPARVAVKGEGQGEISEAGTGSLLWEAPGEPGTYSIVLQASAGDEAARSDPIEVEVVLPASSTPAATAPEPAGSGLPLLQIGLAGLAAVILIALVVTIR